MSMRLDRLEAWLEKVQALALWEVDVGNSRVKAYSVNSHMVIVQVHFRASAEGWEIFVPASLSLNIARTLEAVEKACGL